MSLDNYRPELPYKQQTLDDLLRDIKSECFWDLEVCENYDAGYMGYSWYQQDIGYIQQLRIPVGNHEDGGDAVFAEYMRLDDLIGKEVANHPKIRYGEITHY